MSYARRNGSAQPHGGQREHGVGDAGTSGSTQFQTYVKGELHRAPE
jgi:hypothetical protein